MEKTTTEKEQNIIKSLEQLMDHIEGCNDWESMLLIHIKALIKYIKNDNEKLLESKTNWD